MRFAPNRTSESREEPTPIVYDPFEFLGAGLRVCAALGWAYIGTASNNSKRKWLIANYYDHLRTQFKGFTIEQVCLFFYLLVLIVI